MLIHFDSSAVEASFRAETREPAIKAIENLLRAHDARKHFVSLDAAASRLRALRLSQWARGALESLLTTRKETGNLRHRLGVHVEVGAGPDYDGRLESRAGRYVFRQDLSFFADYERTVRSVLVAEDGTDADVYVEIGRALMLVAHGERRSLTLEARGGGGSSLADAFTASLKAGRMTLAIADSDREAPFTAIGATSRALREAVGQSHGWLLDLGDSSQDKLPGGEDEPARQLPPSCAVVLHVRMLENLLTPEIYQQSLHSHHAETLMELRARSSSPDWLAHVHLKKGLRLREIDSKERHLQPFWQEACASIGYSKCQQEAECERVQDCRCEIVPAIDQRAAEHALSWLKRTPADTIARMMGFRESSPAPAPPGLQTLASLVVSWGFAPAAARGST